MSGYSAMPKILKVNEGGGGGGSVDWSDITNKPDISTISEFTGPYTTSKFLSGTLKINPLSVQSGTFSFELGEKIAVFMTESSISQITSSSYITSTTTGYGNYYLYTEEGARVTQADFPTPGYYIFRRSQNGFTLERGKKLLFYDLDINGNFKNGQDITATGFCSHAEGQSTKATGDLAHSEGYGTEANGNYSHAEGSLCIARDFVGHAEGYQTNAGKMQHTLGQCNELVEGGDFGSVAGSAFVIGNGSTTARSNAFMVNYDGTVKAAGEYTSIGQDYAEYREWADGNPDNEDRRGYFVTYTDGKKIRIASKGDFVAGIISARPIIIGNADMAWQGKFLRDEFGDYIYETSMVEMENPESPGEIIQIESTHYKLNPEYDPSLPYIPRKDRKEWDAVGMLGHLPVRDDGSCEIGKFCSVTDGGIATKSETGYLVVDRITPEIVEVVFSIYA